MKDEFLRLDVELLLCRYGRQKVLSALADIEACSTEELGEKIAQLRARRLIKASRPERKTLTEALVDKVGDAPERLALLRPLIVAFENGALFPTLKSVSRFLDSCDEPVAGIKSRKAAGPLLVKVLSRLGQAELETLRKTISRDGESDYALLSGAILRTDKR
ncbi:MAG TPA: hypothetical protein VF552_11845 [Allosphingosinicella sp.]|jgi:hypothetical protein